MATKRQSFDNTLDAMVSQHRRNTGRGESTTELAAMKGKLESVARGADPKIEAAKRVMEAKQKMMGR